MNIKMPTIAIGIAIGKFGIASNEASNKFGVVFDVVSAWMI